MTFKKDLYDWTPFAVPPFTFPKLAMPWSNYEQIATPTIAYVIKHIRVVGIITSKHKHKRIHRLLIGPACLVLVE